MDATETLASVAGAMLKNRNGVASSNAVEPSAEEIGNMVSSLKADKKDVKKHARGYLAPLLVAAAQRCNVRRVGSPNSKVTTVKHILEAYAHDGSVQFYDNLYHIYFEQFKTVPGRAPWQAKCGEEWMRKRNIKYTKGGPKDDDLIGDIAKACSEALNDMRAQMRHVGMANHNHCLKLRRDGTVHVDGGDGAEVPKRKRPTTRKGRKEHSKYNPSTMIRGKHAGGDTDTVTISKVAVDGRVTPHDTALN
jgi:hypothetical protein